MDAATCNALSKRKRVELDEEDALKGDAATKEFMEALLPSLTNAIEKGEFRCNVYFQRDYEACINNALRKLGFRREWCQTAPNSHYCRVMWDQINIP